jgi:hypothetical protein
MLAAYSAALRARLGQRPMVGPSYSIDNFASPKSRSRVAASAPPAGGADARGLAVRGTIDYAGPRGLAVQLLHLPGKFGRRRGRITLSKRPFMADNVCPQCGREVGASELFCPHCGAAQVPQYSKAQLNRALGQEREGKTRLPVGVGCLVGLVVGIVVAMVADQMDWLIPGVQVRYQQHAEIVMLLMIAGIISGQLIGLYRSKARSRRTAKAEPGSGSGKPPEQRPQNNVPGDAQPHT